MTRLDLGPEPDEPDPPRGARRAVILALAALLTAGAFGLAFVLGAAYFDSRRYAAHTTRLERMLAQSPNVEQVTQGLRDDGSPLLEAPRDDDQWRALLEPFQGPRRDEVLAKRRRWPVTRVYRASDMLYFIFFDEDGTMRDFACLSA